MQSSILLISCLVISSAMFLSFMVFLQRCIDQVCSYLTLLLRFVCISLNCLRMLPECFQRFFSVCGTSLWKAIAVVNIMGFFLVGSGRCWFCQGRCFLRFSVEPQSSLQCFLTTSSSFGKTLLASCASWQGLIHTVEQIAQI